MQPQIRKSGGCHKNQVSILKCCYVVEKSLTERPYLVLTTCDVVLCYRSSVSLTESRGHHRCRPPVITGIREPLHRWSRPPSSPVESVATRNYGRSAACELRRLSALLNNQPNRVFLHVFILQTWTSFILHKPSLSVLQLPSKKLATEHMQVVPNESRRIRHQTIRHRTPMKLTKYDN